MMRTILLIVTLLLGSCANKHENLLYFTSKVQAEKSNETVQIPAISTNSDDVVNNNLALKPIQGFLRSHLTRAKIIAAPVIADNKLFVLDNKGRVICYDFPSIRKIWEHSSVDNNTNISGGGLYYENNTLFVTNSTRNLIIIDAKTGYELTRKLLPDISKTKPVVHQDIIYVLTASNQICALMQNGKTLWQSDSLSQVLTTKNKVYSFFYKNKIIVPFYSDKVSAFDYKTGKVEWDINFSDMLKEGLPDFIPMGLKTQPIVDANYAYFSLSNGMFLKVNLDNGRIVWQKKLEDVHSVGRAKNALFVTNNAAQVVAVSMEDGKIIWSQDLVEPKQKASPLFLTPVLINNQLTVVESNGKIHSLNPENGGILHNFKIDKGAQFINAYQGTFIVFTGSNILVFSLLQ